MKKGKGRNNGLLPNSLRIISSCLKTVSTNVSNVASSVRSAGNSVAVSVSSAEDHKDQVTWAGFDKLELSPSVFKHVLLLGYQNGFQVLDVEDASNFNELVSKRNGPVSFLQMQPLPAKSDGHEGFRASHPLLLVVAGDDTNSINLGQNCGHYGGLARDGNADSQSGNCGSSPTTVQFYSLHSQCYVHVLRFRSSVCMIRCSSRIVAVGLATQIYCFDALTLENKFSVLTFPVPQFVGQGTVGVNVGYGPMSVGPRWLAYASNNPLLSNSGRLSPKNLTPSPGVTPSTSPGGSSLVARYAMESSKHLAAGLINLGDLGYKTLSKYYQELLPDGSTSPVSPHSICKVGRLAGADSDSAGMVIVKDFMSRAVISQFKAHTSPISALCFDPSGTLLVTASVYGNNINIFRIMPSYNHKGSGAQAHDWSSSHVHLYKLHRGITSAMIQDICFSHYSQWVAVVSSKGTCHIFVLSPFGGDSGFQTINSHGEEPSLLPILSLPWWSSSSLVNDKQPFPPPSPVSLSVVSRIKYSSFGWLNTVSNAAAAATGKVFVPSGVIAAVFHNSISDSFQRGTFRSNSLEHLLVYTPSGYVVQHVLLPSVRAEVSDDISKARTNSIVHVQEDDLRVKVEPVQWWDVCRRSDWPEREDFHSQTISERLDSADIIPNKSSSEDVYGINFLDVNDNLGEQLTSKTFSVKSHQRSHWYLSNAEVQVNSRRLPVWQNYKISFFMMDSPRVDNSAVGEFEIEKIPTNEVEIRRKELLPIFDHYHTIKAGWNDRSFDVGRYSHSSSLEPQQADENHTQETVMCHSKPASLSSTESSEGGGSSRRIENLLDLDQMSGGEKCYSPSHQISNELDQGQRGSTINESYMLNHQSLTIVSFPSDKSKTVKDNSHENDCITNTPTSPSLINGVSAVISVLSNDCYDSRENDAIGAHVSQNPVVFELSLQEEHCKALDDKTCCKVTEPVNNDELDSSTRNHLEKTENAEKEGDNDDILGGMFEFFEEG